MKNLQTVNKDNLPIFYFSDPEMKNIFPETTINVTYEGSKTLRELISLSM